MALWAKIVTKIKGRANWDGKEKNEWANIVLIYLRRVISGLFSQRYLHTVLTCWVKLRRVISGLKSIAAIQSTLTKKPGYYPP